MVVAELVYETHVPISMTCENGNGIERGALLTLSDPMKAAVCTVSTAASAGIAAEEKIASDGKTKLPVYRRGIFKVTASGGVVVGEAVVFEISGKVSPQGATQVHRSGISMEDADDGHTFLMELNPAHRVIA